MCDSPLMHVPLFTLNIHLFLYFVLASTEGSCETVHFAACICHKYQNLMLALIEHITVKLVLRGHSK